MIMQNYGIKTVRISRRLYSDMLGLSDAKLKTDDGRTFDVHKAILAINSDYFCAMFCSLDRDDRTEFTVPGITGECLSNVLWYVYTGDIGVTEENVRDLLIAADYLLLKDLQMEIKKCIKASMTERNCLIFLVAAYQTDNEDIFKECFRFIQTRFEGIVRCQKKELEDLPLEMLRTILSNGSLYVYNEATVWKAIVEWTQKDTPSRMCCVPQLLLTLALEDIGEELATDILQHEIISKNSLMKDLIEMRSSKNFTSNRDVVISYLRSYTNRFIVQSQPYKPFQPHSHRIPHNLYVFSPAFIREHSDHSGMYITYDENPDLWRKLTARNNLPTFLIAIGHKIYIFIKSFSRMCYNFDLRAMHWETMEDFTNSYLLESYGVLAIDAYMYILGTIWGFPHSFERTYTYAVEIYDTENCRWFAGVSLYGINYGASVAFEQKIYFVGDTEFDGMTTQMFDPVTQQWSLLPPPTVNRSHFALVTYHEKLYLVGGSTREGEEEEELFYFSNAEVFDPATNLWKVLPDLPYTFKRVKAEVFRDQMVVYDGDCLEGDEKNAVLWNNVMECWEVSDKTSNNFNAWRFCSVHDVDTIRMITKQNRDPKTQMDKSYFT